MVKIKGKKRKDISERKRRRDIGVVLDKKKKKKRLPNDGRGCRGRYREDPEVSSAFDVWPRSMLDNQLRV